MSKNFFLIIIFLFVSYAFLGQSKDSKWTAGASFATAKYTGEQAIIVGGQFAPQTPRINVSRYLYKGLIADAGFATAIGGNVKYTTLDTSIRYDFNRSNKNVVPYLALGGSYVFAKEASPTLNLGLGNTFWFRQNYGVNIQLIFRISPDNFDFQRSHFYPSAGIVYSFQSRSLVPRLWQKY